MATATMNVNLKAQGFIQNLADQLRAAANRLQPIDRDQLKAVIVKAGDAPAEIADAVVAYLSHGDHRVDAHDEVGDGRE